MSEPRPVYVTATHAGIELVPEPIGYAELHSAYRAVVSAGLTLQRELGLPPERCAILTRAERLERRPDCELDNP